MSKQLGLSSQTVKNLISLRDKGASIADKNTWSLINFLLSQPGLLAKLTTHTYEYLTSRLIYDRKVKDKSATTKTKEELSSSKKVIDNFIEGLGNNFYSKFKDEMDKTNPYSPSKRLFDLPQLGDSQNTRKKKGNN